jgi:hypothetical protein
MISSTGDKGMKGGELRAAGSRSVNPIERREVVYDRIQLDQTSYWPVNEELPKKALEELASRCFTIEGSLEEEGVVVIGYPDSEPRIMDVPMLVKISDGTSRSAFLCYLQEIEYEARNNWEYFLRMARQVSLDDEMAEDLYGGEHGGTD